MGEKLPQNCRHCGETDLDKLVKRSNGKPYRLCKNCKNLFQRKALAKRPLSCPCGESDPDMMVVRGGRKIRFCVNCNGNVLVMGRGKRPQVCCGCGVSGNGFVKGLCAVCERNRRNLSREQILAAKATEYNNLRIGQQDLEKMAQVRAAIKAIPVGVTVTPPMLYDISRRVAEGAL